MAKLINFLHPSKNYRIIPEYNVWGSGVEICKDVVASYDEGPEGVKNYYNQYIVGAITGMMVALEETSQIDNGDDLIAQTLFYCREHPLEPLGDEVEV